MDIGERVSETISTILNGIKKIAKCIVKLICIIVVASYSVLRYILGTVFSYRKMQRKYYLYKASRGIKKHKVPDWKRHKKKDG